MGAIAFFWALSVVQTRADIPQPGWSSVGVLGCRDGGCATFSIAANGGLNAGVGSGGWAFALQSDSWIWLDEGMIGAASVQSGLPPGFAVNLIGPRPVNSVQWIGGAAGGPPSGPPMPEPGSLLLFGSGWAGWQAWKRMQEG
jgi:hypothetical protein